MGSLLLFLLCLWPPNPPVGQAISQIPAADPDLLKTATELLEREQFAEILTLIPDSDDIPVDLLYCRGLALAGMSRWAEARAALERARALNPRDKRFPVELAGIALKERRYPESKRRIRDALRLDPGDTYANEFLATLFFLEGNLEAAIKSWNRSGDRPVLEELRSEPSPRTDPVLLDRCYAFAPAETLKLADYVATRARLDSLGVFPRYRFELQPRRDGRFDCIFRPIEKSGWGGTAVEAVISTARGLPYRTLLPEYFNISRRAWNFRSLARWDPNKRRLFTSLSGPLLRDPSWHLGFSVDGRDEIWNVQPSWQADLPPLPEFRLKTLKGSIRLDNLIGDRWSWFTEVQVGSRHYPDLKAWPEVPPGLFAEGVSLGQSVGISNRTLNLPEYRLVLQSDFQGRWGRIFRSAGKAFGTAGGSLEMTWQPAARGSDLRLTGRAAAQKAFGSTPFDAFQFLGLDRDTDLHLRGHRAIRDGRKGAGPAGSGYVLFAAEVDKDIYRSGLWGLVLTPFLDVGKAVDATGYFGSPAWQWDAGIQLRLLILERVFLVFSYGRSLRTGENAFFTSTYGPAY